MAGIFDNLVGLFTGAPQAQASKTAAGQQVAGIKKGMQQGSHALKSGQTSAIGAETSALGPWQSIFGAAQPLSNLYNEALQGGQGAADAFKTFWGSTGSQFLLDKANEGFARTFGSMGQVGAGGMAAADYAGNLVSQQFGTWLSDLFKGGQAQQDVAAGGMADIYNKEGGIYQQTGKELSDLLSGAQSQIGAAKAAGTVGAATAGATGASNLLNTIFGAGELGIQAFGGGAGGINSLFGTGLYNPNNWGTTVTTP